MQALEKCEHIYYCLFLGIFMHALSTRSILALRTHDRIMNFNKRLEESSAGCKICLLDAQVKRRQYVCQENKWTELILHKISNK